MADFKHIVEPEHELESEKVTVGIDRALLERLATEEAPRKRLRDDLPLTRGAICLSAIVLIGAGVFEWAGVGPAVFAVGASILYAQGTRFIR